MTTLNTTTVSARLRNKIVDTLNKRVLITNFYHTEQEQDFTEPANCQGFGRIRHFRRTSSGTNWPSNPLPIEPASKVLGLGHLDILKAQVFQNAACNWRCWYCFVPFNLLAANTKYAAWQSATDLISLYLAEPDPPVVIDLTGGQPDLAPEWVLWMMEELRIQGLDKKVYLWSDDNLSTDYFWRYLSESEREVIATYPNYGRVCCFKGFDEQSFSFNTLANPELFNQQFELVRRFLDLNLDLYFYATFTAPTSEDVAEKMHRFVERLQELDENLPLRVVPLNVQIFTPVKHRLDEAKQLSMQYHQYQAIEAWQKELTLRYSSDELSLSITQVPLRCKKKK